MALVVRLWCGNLSTTISFKSSSINAGALLSASLIVDIQYKKWSMTSFIDTFFIVCPIRSSVQCDIAAGNKDNRIISQLNSNPWTNNTFLPYDIILSDIYVNKYYFLKTANFN